MELGTPIFQISNVTHTIFATKSHSSPASFGVSILFKLVDRKKMFRFIPMIIPFFPSILFLIYFPILKGSGSAVGIFWGHF